MQELTATFDVNVVGSESGNPYHGTFTVRTLLTRRQVAVADEVRRSIIGSNPEGVMPVIAADAFVAGQLSVRVIEAPDWFKNAGVGGIQLPDPNVLEEIFSQAIKAEEKRKSSLNKEAEEAVERLKKKPK